MKHAVSTVAQAIDRALSMVGLGIYWLGTGDYTGTALDVPWTARDGMLGSDCAGFALCWIWMIVRHMPGFNRGDWATVEDDLNCNSAIEDAEHKQEFFTIVETGDPVLPGDLLVYPTIRLKDSHGEWLRDEDGKIREWIGHVQFVLNAHGALAGGHYSAIDIVHCHGPNGRGPGVTVGKATAMDMHNHDWPKPEHCVKVLRVIQPPVVEG